MNYTVQNITKRKKAQEGTGSSCYVERFAAVTVPEFVIATTNINQLSLLVGTTIVGILDDWCAIGGRGLRHIKHFAAVGP